jgi:lysozyme family protein
MSDFGRAIQKILRHEGVQFDAAGMPVPGRTGYANHPDDPGKETNYGVTIAVAREFGYAGPMRDIPYATVLKIYRLRYWDVIRGDEIPDQEIAEELFDTGVNCGVGVAKTFLQRVLNVLNKKGVLWPDITVDGVVGPKTVAVLVTALKTAPYYRLCILRALDSLQCVRYIELAEEKEKFETFVGGWLRTRVGVKDDVA